MATRVYSPAGEPFDIPRRDLADKLILEEGWTQTPPITLVEEEPKPKKKRTPRRKSKVEPVFENDGPFEGFPEEEEKPEEEDNES